MRKASWVLLTVVAVAVLLLSLLSAWVTYFTPERSVIAGKPLPQHGLASDFEVAIRAQRGTAAAFGAAFGTLLLFVVLGPYRRGETWCWWAILTGLLVLNAVTLLRIPALGYSLGSGSSLTLLGLAGLGLLLDVGRLRRA